MTLVAEGFDNGGKAAVNGVRSYWVDGETVRINGANYRVNVSDGRAYASDVAEAAIYRALYPDTLASSAALDENSVTVNIPRTYTYRVSGGRQLLGVPMAAYGTSGSQLVFKHLTAAVTVLVANNFGIDIEVDSIVVSSPTYQLGGSRNITLGADMTVEACTTAVAADRRVVVYFDGGTPLKVNSGDTAAVQVPVLPVGSDNKFTVTVGVHNADEDTMKYTFSRTQTTGGSLVRAQMGYAPASFGGIFTVGTNKQVRFSPRNLQYYCSSSSSKWRFALQQYDTAVFDISYYSSTSKKWIDLFGFATSGCSLKPYMKSDNLSNYYHSEDISAGNYDWGWYNKIYNGGNENHIWRTMTVDEWYNVAESSNIIKGIIEVGNNDSRKGLIILCDNFQAPTGINYSKGSSHPFSDNTFTLEQWNKMEVAGAVFLPLVRRRNLTGKIDGNNSYYWSSTPKSETTAHDFWFGNTIYGSPTTGSLLYFGQCVRLVRDVVNN